VTNTTLFRKEKVNGDWHYLHCHGEYVIRKLTFRGYKRKRWGVEYVGPARGPNHEPMRGFENTLGEMMSRVEKHYTRVPDDARERVLHHVRKGEDLAAADSILDYIDSKFDELENEMERRFNNLKISSSGGGYPYS